MKAAEFGPPAPPPFLDGGEPERPSIFLIVGTSEARREMEDARLRRTRPVASGISAVVRVDPDGSISDLPHDTWIQLAQDEGTETLERSVWATIDEVGPAHVLLTVVALHPVAGESTRLRARRIERGWQLVSASG